MIDYLCYAGLGSGVGDEASETYNTIDFALDLDDTHCCGRDLSRYEIFENGARLADLGVYQVGDMFEVLVNDAGLVEYWLESMDSGAVCTDANTRPGSSGHCSRRTLIRTAVTQPVFPCTSIVPS